LSEVSGNQPAGGSQILAANEGEGIVACDLQRSSYTQRLIPVGRLTATV
jgi:hypothetical protein